jgi:hypothetical protein
MMKTLKDFAGSSSILSLSGFSAASSWNFPKLSQERGEKLFWRGRIREEIRVEKVLEQAASVEDSHYENSFEV